ncbi:hypothetical protein BCR36DRAFT_586425 [Piromyces finnis]|uniref:Chitin-binding type-3 domain-containing protein n=1 Tax=Piromyces finnis TaxID=1754191 RepID=A0A1Y1UIR3_9FUNG|nr:hypothetical protein BCR36DRAFT_588419 [Piromyces finnis]ORX43964.1 hypothetical protein BCR36DRAFT_586425 [Piromyces finnis]|eukprot:ORX36995.1 hypothetical protein BCR36DRAFT_588419 [Piromyces finnis]
MGDLWKPNTLYEPKGLKIEYEGVIYELIQPHTSQYGWEPTQTPAIWKVSEDQEGVKFRRQDEEMKQKMTLKERDDVPYQWVPYTGSMPENAIGIANKHKTFYVARSHIHGGIHPGYADQYNSRCFIGYGGKEEICERFEVLVCEPNKYQWVSCSNINDVDGNLVIGGNESDGTPLYVCKCYREKVAYIGKTSKATDNAFYSFSEKEHRVKKFEVLTFL